MRLRTKIILISCISVLAALLAGDIIIWILAGKSFMNEAVAGAYQESFIITKDLEQKLNNLEKVTYNIDSVYLQYLMKSYKDDYNICIRRSNDDFSDDVEEIYNHTIFTPEMLMDKEYKRHEGYEELYYTDFSWENRHYIVFYYVWREIDVYHINDITDVWNKMEWLILCTIFLTVFLTAVTSLILFRILNRVLEPLKELNDTTKSMAEGVYGQRVEIRKMDEIGQLGENFNKMADAVETRTRSLEESEKRKTLFMGDLTHELKTPLTAISGYAQTLLSAKISKEDEEEALMYIDEECKRLGRLSQKMMRLLELDQDAVMEVVETPVKVLFDAAAKACKAILKEKQIVLECTEHGEVFPMDLDLMTDALINLIDNGVKASPVGGKIVLKAYDRCIEVEDFGQGIPKEEQDRIMEPFYMIDKSRSRKSGGAGLGLALTALIAKRHNIGLRIDSEVGRGTRFILQFV